MNVMSCVFGKCFVKDQGRQQIKIHLYYYTHNLGLPFMERGRNESVHFLVWSMACGARSVALYSIVLPSVS